MMRGIELVLLAALVFSLPCAAQPGGKDDIERFRDLSADSPPAPRSAKPKSALSPTALVSELRKGGYLLYFRHAATNA